MQQLFFSSWQTDTLYFVGGKNSASEWKSTALYFTSSFYLLFNLTSKDLGVWHHDITNFLKTLTC